MKSAASCPTLSPSSSLKSNCIPKTIRNESHLLRFIITERPAKLFGQSWSDLRETLHKIEGIALKLKIHGFEDRAKLLNSLSLRLSQNDGPALEVYTRILHLLLELSERPTHVATIKFNSSLNFDDDLLQNVPVEQDGDKDSLMESLLCVDNDFEARYSSDDNLSEWSFDSSSKESDNYNSCESEEDGLIDLESSQKHQVEKYWDKETSKAEEFISKIRITDNVLAIQQKAPTLFEHVLNFGLFWEGMNAQKLQNQAMVILSEEEVIRDVILTCSTLDVYSSKVFNHHWAVKKNILINSLSASALSSLTSHIGSHFKKLENISRLFDCHNSFTASRNSCILKPTFRSCINIVIRHINKHLEDLEQRLKLSTMPSDNEQKNHVLMKNSSSKTCYSANTLINLTFSLGNVFKMIAVLDRAVVGTLDIHGEEIKDCSICCAKLISTLEFMSMCSTDSISSAMSIFMYYMCFRKFLTELTVTVCKSYEEKDWLYDKFEVEINDPSFWSQCCKIKNSVTSILQSSKGTKSLKYVLQAVLRIYKAQEMFRQLDRESLDYESVPTFIAQETMDKLIERALRKKITLSRIDKLTSSGLSLSKLLVDSQSYALGSFDSVFGSIIEPPTYRSVYDGFNLLDILLNTDTSSMLLTEVMVPILRDTFEPHSEMIGRELSNTFIQHQLSQSIRTFRDIVLGGNENFIDEFIKLTSNYAKVVSDFEETERIMNMKHKQLLDEYWSDSCRNFSLHIHIDKSEPTKFTFSITPYFPLNLILEDKIIRKYKDISRLLFQIRKCSLQMRSTPLKDLVTIDGVPANRIFLLRFSLLNFVNNLRSYFLHEIFANTADICNVDEVTFIEDSVDVLGHSSYLAKLEEKLLIGNKFMDIIVREVFMMCEVTHKFWCRGLPLKHLIRVEDCLKKCWYVVSDVTTPCSTSFKGLSYYFNHPPSHLMTQLTSSKK